VFLASRYSHPDYGDTKQVMAGIDRTVQQLRQAGKRVVLVYPYPTAPANVPELLARTQLTQGDYRKAGFPRSQYESGNRIALAALDSIRGPGIEHVVPAQMLCPGSTCELQANGDVLYFDNNHLTIEGARYLEPLFQSLFDQRPDSGVRPTPGPAYE
jgi:hypothetical protein